MGKQNQELKPGDEFPLTIKRLGINGEGIGYFKRKAVFIPGALPGEEVIGVVKANQEKFIQADMKKVRKRSKDRVDPPCPVYGPCGGCQLQHLDYKKQLEYKRDIILQAFERYAKGMIKEELVHPTFGLDHPWDYRNKSQLQVGMDGNKVIAGLYGQDSHRLVDISDCLVQHPLTNHIAKTMKSIIQDLKIPVYNERNQKGIIRTIVSRVGFQTKQAQLVLVTTSKDFPKKDILVKEIKKRLPEIHSLILNINNKKTSLIFGEETHHLEGAWYLEEKLEDINFELSARAFFQLNPKQTTKMYNEVKRVANLSGKEKIVDVYCGVGTIGLWLADKVSELRGIEVIPDAVKDAERNAKKQGIKHASFVTGKAEEWLPKWQKEGFQPDVIIVDPPRVGCENSFLDTIKKVKPKKFIYVSCNPSTLTKDISYLGKMYKVESVQPVDMFPQTSQVESVTLLTRA